MSAPKVGVELHGKLAGFPLVVTISRDGGVMNWAGQLQIEGQRLHDLVRLDDIDPLDADLSALLDKLDEQLAHISSTLRVAHERGLLRCSLSENGLKLSIVRRGQDMAFTINLATSRQDNPPRLERLYQEIARVRQCLPNVDILLAYRRGSLSLAEVSNGFTMTNAPGVLSGMRWLLLGKYTFGNAAGKAIRTLFGGSGELDLVAGYDDQKHEFTVCLTIPAANTKYVVVEGLYVLVTVGKEPRFKFQGDFRVPRWKDVRLHASCSFTPTSFYLSAEIDFGDRFDFGFLQEISFDQAALLIGVTGGAPTLGFLATLRIRNFSLFGALILTIEGNVPVPQLVCGAMAPVSIPALYKGFSDHTIEGFDSLEIFEVKGLNFSLTQKFDMNLFVKGDEDGIAQFFNEHRNDSMVALSPEQIQIRRHENGYALIDRQRMRHYFVDAFGELSLRPQFYYSVVSGGSLGSFSTDAGLFVCGRLEVFNTGFEALFSLREGDGLQAYAQLDPIHLGGFVHFTAAKNPSPIKTITLAEDDPLGGLISKKNTGAMFFLSASKRQVALSFNGRLAVGRLFEEDAVIVYAAGHVAIHVTTQVFGVSAQIAISASYADFCSAKLDLQLYFDATNVEAGLKSVREKVKTASKALAATIENAHDALVAAQARVNKLRDEMVLLDARIAKCKRAIERASGFKKPLVALAKGVEILAYEATKAALWTTMQAANAALVVAHKAVDAMGHVGADVLEFVQNAIGMANSLIFVRHVEISAHMDSSSQVFNLNAEIVVLGNVYSYNHSAEFNALQKGLSSFLDTYVSEKMKQDLNKLDRIENAESAMVFGERAEPEPGSIPQLRYVSAEMQKASRIFNDALVQYRQNFEEDLSDGDALRTAFLGGIALANHAFAGTKNALTGADPSKIRALVAPSPLEFAAEASPELDGLQSAFNAFDDAAALQIHVDAASSALGDAEKQVAGFHEAEREAATLEFAAPPRLSEGEFLEALHAKIVATYADEPATGCINLAREPNLTRYFDEALIALGRQPTPKRETPIVTTSMGGPSYRPRL